MQNEETMMVANKLCLLFFLVALLNDRTDCESDITKVCYGTNNQLSRTENADFRYLLARHRYTGCTHVIGNVEIIGISASHNASFNLNFLSSIRVVTGYIVIGEVGVDVIPLTSLIQVRGESTLDLSFGKFSFLVYHAETSELQMPRIKDISGGKVLLLHVQACNLNTIDWKLVTNDVTLKDVTNPHACDPCSPECPADEGVRRCWGRGSDMCQQIDRRHCDLLCGAVPCFKEGLLGCCHPTCAFGCSGPLDTECEVCRHHQYEGRCVTECPIESFPYGPDCLPLK